MRRHIALIFVGLIASADAWSASELPDTLSHTLDEVVVSGASAPKSALSTAPLQQIDREQMLRTGIADVSDAMRRMPGVTLRDYGGAGGLKTVSVRGFGAAHTGVFYDGVPLSDVQSGQVDLSRYSIDNVGSVSLTIGDNDDIFIPARTAASANTVNISTQPAADRRELCVKLRGGSFGLINPFLRVGTPIGDKVAMNVVGEYTHANNDYPFTLRNGDFVTREKRNNSMMNSGHGEVNMLWRPNNRNTLTTKVYYYDNSRDLPGPVIYYNNVNHEHLRERNAMAQAQWRTRLSSVLRLSALAKYNFGSSFYHDENGKYPGGILDQRYWQREYYVSGALLYTPLQCLSFDYSADYFYNNLNSNLVDDGRPYRNSFLQSLTAKYTTSRLILTGRVLLSIYDNGAKQGTSSKDVTKLSPSLSLSFRPMQEHLFFLRASYKNIFRMPTFNEAYFDHYGSTDILPESTDQVNLGVTYTAPASGLLSSATFSVDGYLNHIRDMIVAVPFNMFIWSMVNLGKVVSTGVDVSGVATLTPRNGHDITFTLSYSFQRAMPRTDRESSEWMKQVAYIPKHSGSASIGYENPWVNLSLSATGASERYTTNNNLPATHIDGYIDMGASAWHTFNLRKTTLDLRLDILNLLDTQYYIVARYPMPGRQYRMTITLNY